MVPCEVPEVTLDQLDLVPRPQNHALPASCQKVPEPGMQAAVNTITGGDSSNKGCFGRKTNLFRESGDFAGNRETWEIFREI